jgi:hypothetical protein
VLAAWAVLLDQCPSFHSVGGAQLIAMCPTNVFLVGRHVSQSPGALPGEQALPAAHVWMVGLCGKLFPALSSSVGRKA